MNAYRPIIKAVLPLAIVLTAFPVAAADNPTRSAETVAWARTQNHLVIECDQPDRPELKAITSVSGDPNLVQARTDRDRLMARVRQACNREGTREVWVVRELPPAEPTAGRMTASNRPAK